MASTEMQQIQQQVNARNTVLFSREHATAAAYLQARPQQFSYIHFVAHGVASRTDPLDSAIILSRSSSAEDSFKLHARDIIQHPSTQTLLPFRRATAVERDHLPVKGPSALPGLSCVQVHTMSLARYGRSVMNPLRN